MTTVSVRYITDDVDAAVPFYVDRLGFTVEMRPGPGFAVLSRGDLRLLLNQPGAGGAGQPMPDGRRPEPGGWNRIQIEVADLEREVDTLRAAGAAFAARSSPGEAGARSCSTIPPAIPSSSSSRPAELRRERAPSTTKGPADDGALRVLTCWTSGRGPLTMRPGGRAPARTATAPRCGFRSQRVQHRLVLAAGHLQGPVMTVTQLRTTPFLWSRQSTERPGRGKARAPFGGVTARCRPRRPRAA